MTKNALNSVQQLINYSFCPVLGRAERITKDILPLFGILGGHRAWSESRVAHGEWQTVLCTGIRLFQSTIQGGFCKITMELKKSYREVVVAS